MLDRGHDLGHRAVRHSVVGAQVQRRLGDGGLDVAEALLEFALGATSASSKYTAPVVSTVTVMAFCCSGGVVCTVRGRLTWMALVSAGIVMTNATSSTSMTSTSGVMLISLSTSLSSEVETAISIAPLDL